MNRTAAVETPIRWPWCLCHCGLLYTNVLNVVHLSNTCG